MNGVARQLSNISAFCFGLACFAAPALAQRTLSIPSQTVPAGSQISVSVDLSEGNGVGGIQFHLSYNSQFLSIDNPGGGDLSQRVQRGSLVPTGHVLTVNASQPGSISVAIAGASTFHSGTGSVITVPFEVHANSGTSILSLSGPVGSSPAGAIVSVVSSSGAVTVMASSPNQQPVAVDDSAVTLKNESVVIDVLANDFDPDGDPLTIDSVTQGANGSVQINANKTLTYQPNPQFVGTDSFTYQITDGRGGSDSATVTVQVVENDTSRLFFAPARIDPGTDSKLQDTFVGIGLVNPNESQEEVDLRLLTPQGIATDAADFTMHAGQKRVFLTTEELNLTADSSTVFAEGSNGGIRGLFMFGDAGLNRQDGISADLKDATELYISKAVESELVTTMLSLFNAGDEDALVFIRAFSPAGTLLRTGEVMLAPSGAHLGTLRDVMGSDFQMEEGFLKVESHEPIRGLAIIADEHTFSTVEAQAGEAVARLVAPHYFIDTSGGSSELRLLNPATTSATVVIRGYDSHSELLSTREFVIAPGELRIWDMAQLIDVDLDPGRILTGFLEISVANASAAPARMVGTISFSGPGGKARTSLSLISEGRNEILIPHLAQIKDVLFTGLAILNVSGQAAQTQLNVFDHAGVLRAQRTIQIEPRQLVVDLLSSQTFFGVDFEPPNGYMRIDSTERLVTFTIIGDFRSEFLSAIHSQAP